MSELALSYQQSITAAGAAIAGRIRNVLRPASFGVVPEAVSQISNTVEDPALRDFVRERTQPHRIIPRPVVACVASIALIAGAGSEYVDPEEAVAQVPSVSAKQHELTSQPSVLSPIHKAKCTPHTRVLFTLRGSFAVAPEKPEPFILTAKACPGKKPLKKIKVIGHNEQGQKATWKIQNLAPGDERQRKLKLSFPEATPGVSNNETATIPLIAVQASRSDGRRVGSNRWLLKAKKQPCTPRPDFQVAAQADNEIVGNEHMDTATAVGLLRSVLGVTALRINVIPAQVKARGGYDPYIRAIDTAKANGIKDVYVTIMQNPRYLPGDLGVSRFDNFDPNAIRTFAREVATTLGQRVMRYSVINEPNHPLFSQFYAKKDQAMYVSAYTAGREGILEANPLAEVEAGELASGSNLSYWVNMVSTLPSDGVTIHPYKEYIYRLREYKKLARGRLSVSEDGVFNTVPHHMTKTAQRLRVAWCAGVGRYILYNPFDYANPSTGENTGFINLGGDNTSAQKAFRAAVSTKGVVIKR